MFLTRDNIIVKRFRCFSNKEYLLYSSIFFLWCSRFKPQTYSCI